MEVRRGSRAQLSLQDYNLAVLPHIKYYDLERACRRPATLTHAGYTRHLDANRPEEDLVDEARYDPKADEQIVLAAHRVKRAQAELTREEVLECVDPLRS